MKKITLSEAFRHVPAPWQPRVAAELNGQVVKLVRLEGEFTWHSHDREDELFLVVTGRMRMELRSETIVLEPGEMLVVPAASHTGRWPSRCARWCCSNRAERGTPGTCWTRG